MKRDLEVTGKQVSSCKISYSFTEVDSRQVYWLPKSVYVDAVIFTLL